MKIRFLLGVATVLCCLLISAVALAQSSANFSLSWSTLASGGVYRSPNYALQGAVGQAVAQRASSAGVVLNSGFVQNFSSTSTPVPTPGDTAEPTPGASPTSGATPTPGDTVEPTPVGTPTNNVTPTPEDTVGPAPTANATPTSGGTAEPTPAGTPTVSVTPVNPAPTSNPTSEGGRIYLPITTKGK